MCSLAWCWPCWPWRAFKMLLIALDYMELWQAPALWRRAVLGWLVVVLGLIASLSVLGR